MGDLRKVRARPGATPGDRRRFGGVTRAESAATDDKDTDRRASDPARHVGCKDYGLKRFREVAPVAGAANDDRRHAPSGILLQSLWLGISAQRGHRALLLVGSQNRVLRASASACDLIKRTKRFVLTGRTLECLQASDQVRLDAAIAAGLRPSSPENSVVRLDEGSRGTPLLLTFQPLTPVGGARDALPPLVLVSIIDPVEPIHSRSQLWTPLFGLTTREAALLHLMAQGHSAESAAATLEISLPTARTHLRHIFQKTGTDRQSDLIRLLNRVS